MCGCGGVCVIDYEYLQLEEQERVEATPPPADEVTPPVESESEESEVNFDSDEDELDDLLPPDHKQGGWSLPRSCATVYVAQALCYIVCPSLSLRDSPHSAHPRL